MTAKTAQLNLATTAGPKMLTDSIFTVNGAAAPADAEAQVQKMAYGEEGDAKMVSLTQP